MRNLVPLFALILFTGCKNTVPKKEKISPPNIIYIMADDLGHGDLGVYGQLFATPNQITAKGDPLFATLFWLNRVRSFEVSPNDWPTYRTHLYQG